MQTSTYIRILSKSSLGVIWLWPSGSRFSICVGLTHFSPRPPPTVLSLKHMCGGGRGINECLPRGTCWHRLQIWYWSPFAPDHICLQYRVHISMSAYTYIYIHVLFLFCCCRPTLRPFFSAQVYILSFLQLVLDVEGRLHQHQWQRNATSRSGIVFNSLFFQWSVLADEIVSLHTPRTHWGLWGVRHIWANRLLMSCLHEPLIIAWERKSRVGGGELVRGWL